MLHPCRLVGHQDLAGGAPEERFSQKGRPKLSGGSKTPWRLFSRWLVRSFGTDSSSGRKSLSSLPRRVPLRFDAQRRGHFMRNASFSDDRGAFASWKQRVKSRRTVELFLSPLDKWGLGLDKKPPGPRKVRRIGGYSNSMVAGGLLVMS